MILYWQSKIPSSITWKIPEGKKGRDKWHSPLFSLAMRKAIKDICGLISSWHTSTLVRLMAGRAFCRSSLHSSMLAPATMTIAFSPVEDTETLEKGPQNPVFSIAQMLARSWELYDVLRNLKCNAK